MILVVLGVVAVFLAAVPCGLFLANLREYGPPPKRASSGVEPISVLIPARNEESNIRGTIEAALSNTGCEFEVVVLDDHSQK
jgi:cellulose synthase/poly-beta-1,6-N-acetylglucosamine synthase-like glycosyltransferase